MRAKSLLLAVVFLFVCLPAQAGIIDAVPGPSPCTENCPPAASENGDSSELTDALSFLVDWIL